MFDMQGLTSRVAAAGSINSRALTSMQPSGCAQSTTPDGSTFFTNNGGEIVYAMYSSGAIVKRNLKQIAVRTADGDYWLSNDRGNWFRVD